MNCNQLGGACKKEFHADTFEAMVVLSKQHGMEMFQAQDRAHLEAMEKIQKLMKTPKDMQNWFNSKKAEFNALPENLS
jgi:hypothetical protein